MRYDMCHLSRCISITLIFGRIGTARVSFFSLIQTTRGSCKYDFLKMGKRRELLVKPSSKQTT
jgi:hypothetical protein